jgi:chromosome partitioning protein
MSQAKTVVVGNLKGGAGKSTTAINLATAAEGAGIRTAIIDIDPEQQAAARWKDSRPAERPTVHSAVHTRIIQAISEAVDKGAELVLIDCPALSPAITTEAIKLAHLVLIPCRTTVQDIQFLTTTADIAATHKKPTAVVLNAVEPQIKETDEARAFVEKEGLALAPVHLSKAVAFHRAITAGLGVTEYEPTGKAAQETLHLLNWISRLLDLSQVIHVEPTAA